MLRPAPVSAFGRVGMRWIEIVSRVAAALFGGYALAAVSAVFLALSLPLARSEAVLTGIMISFVVYVCAALWVFAASSAWRAWAGLVLPGLLLGGAIVMLRFGAAA